MEAQSTDYLAKDFKILLYKFPALRIIEGLKNVFIHCSDLKDLQIALEEYRESTIIIACSSSDVVGVDKLIITYPIDSLYIFNDETDELIREWSYGIVLSTITEVNNEKQLMRHLSTKTMLCYFNQGLECRKKGNYGMANLCFRDSLDALNYSATFI